MGYRLPHTRVVNTRALLDGTTLISDASGQRRRPRFPVQTSVGFPGRQVVFGLFPHEAGPNATSKCRAHGQHEDPTCARASKPKTTCRLWGHPYTHDPPCGPGPNDSARTKSGEKQTWLQPGWKLELKFKCRGFRTAPGRRRPQDPLKRAGPARKLEQDSPKIKPGGQI